MYTVHTYMGLLFFRSTTQTLDSNSQRRLERVMKPVLCTPSHRFDTSERPIPRGYDAIHFHRRTGSLNSMSAEVTLLMGQVACWVSWVTNNGHGGCKWAGRARAVGSRGPIEIGTHPVGPSEPDPRHHRRRSIRSATVSGSLRVVAVQRTAPRHPTCTTRQPLPLNPSCAPSPATGHHIDRTSNITTYCLALGSTTHQQPKYS
jgi:hypothetical protein